MSSRKHNTNGHENTEISHLIALRTDWPTGISISFVLLATICVATSINALVGTSDPFPYEQPIFWIMVVIFLVWYNYLRNYSQKSMASYRIMMIIDIPLSLLITGIAYMLHADTLGFYIGANILTIILISISVWYYRKSVLRKLGPVH